MHLGITDSQYIVADLIYRLSTNPSAPVPGWCSMSKKKIISFLGYKERTLSSYIKALRESDIIESSLDGRHLKTTKNYNLKRLRHETKPSAISADSTQNLRMESAISADVYRVRDRLVSLLENHKEKFRLRFTRLNLEELTAAARTFAINAAAGKYGDEIKDDDVALLLYEKFLISFDLNRNARSKSPATAESEQPDYTDKNYYN